MACTPFSRFPCPTGEQPAVRVRLRPLNCSGLQTLHFDNSVANVQITLGVRDFNSGGGQMFVDEVV